MHSYTDIALLKKTVSCILITQPYMTENMLVDNLNPLSAIVYILLHTLMQI